MTKFSLPASARVQVGNMYETVQAPARGKRLEIDLAQCGRDDCCGLS
jgi:hypothetical protein